MSSRKLYLLIISLLFLNGISIHLFGQSDANDPPEKVSIFKDTLDGKIDLSRFLIEANGFIPLVQLITEPALGNIGGVAAPIFIKPNKYSKKGSYVPPDITALFGAYTGNNSWAVGGVRIASLPQWKLKYRAGLAYTDINMDFYRTLPIEGERKFSFNFNTTIAFASVLREIGNSDVFIGLNYQFLKNKVEPDFDISIPPEFLENFQFDHNLSSLGLDVELDKRDNVFTPNKGWYVITEFKMNDNWTGSDYEFQNLLISVIKYFQFHPNLVSGFRYVNKFQFGDAPFYMKPGVNLRGVPLARYQGDESYVLETEQRYDINRRWSVLGFGGVAKAVLGDETFSDSDLIYNYGGGFRYLIARQFGARMGIDVAWSNEDFGYYIVFGSSWNNRN